MPVCISKADVRSFLRDRASPVPVNESLLGDALLPAVLEDFAGLRLYGKNAWVISKDAMHEGCELDLVLFLHTTTYKFSLTFLLNHTTSIY